MASTTVDIKSEIKSLLTGALPAENLENFHIEFVGTTEKGDGFIGDIFFVNLTSKKKIYNFVLKCGKPSEALRKSAPVKDAFEQEIYIYNTVLPAFRKFEMEHNIDDVFDSVPKCYGTFVCHRRELIVLENLKILGYGLWDKKLPMPRHYIESVLKQYGRWHAISAAMQDQELENFEQLSNNMIDAWPIFCEASFFSAYYSAVDNVSKVWENDMDEDVLKQWKQLRNHVKDYVINLRKKSATFNVITHGDCWNNNFMFKTTGDDENSKEVKVAMLDWQVSGLSSPVNDVSYFLYACVSEEDLKDFDGLLKVYYRSFAEHLTKLGSDPEKIYTYSNLLDDWKVYARLGILTAAIIFNIINVDEDDVPDMAQLADKGEDIAKTFCTNIKDVDYVKQRSRSIIEHAIERDLFKPIESL